jgi:hypothetical protein
MLTNDTPSLDSSYTDIVNWLENAPRGGKAVLNGILKEKATVPPFFAQTLVTSLRKDYE